MKKIKKYKSLGVKRTIALSVGATGILGGVAIASLTYRYFLKRGVATKKQVDSFWETIQNDAASYFKIDEYDNKDGEALLNVNTNEFIDFIHSANLSDDWKVEIEIPYPNGTIEKYEYAQSKDEINNIEALSSLNRLQLFKNSRIRFFFKLSPGSWAEISNPIDRTNNFKTDNITIREAKWYPIENIVDNENKIAFLNYPEQLYTLLEEQANHVSKGEPIPMDNLQQIFNNLYNLEIFGRKAEVFNDQYKPSSILSKSHGVKIEFLRSDLKDGWSEYDNTSDLFTGFEYNFRLTLDEDNNFTKFLDSRLNSEQSSKYLNFKVYPDTTPWIFKIDEDKLQNRFDEYINSTEAKNDNLFSGTSTDVSINLTDKQDEWTKNFFVPFFNKGNVQYIGYHGNVTFRQGLWTLVNDSNKKYSWGDTFTLKFSNDTAGQSGNADLVTIEGQEFTFVIPNNSTQKTKLPWKKASDVFSLLQKFIQNLIDQSSLLAIDGVFSGNFKKEYDKYISQEGLRIRDYFSLDHYSFNNLTQNSLKKSILSFEITPNSLYVFDDELISTVGNSSIERIVNTDNLQTDWEVNGLQNLLIPINNPNTQFTSIVEDKDSWKGHKNGNIEFLLNNAEVDSKLNNIEITFISNKDSLFIGDEIIFAFRAKEGYIINNGNNSYSTDGFFAYEIPNNFDFNHYKKVIDIDSENDLKLIMENIVKDKNNYFGDFFTDLLFTIPLDYQTDIAHNFKIEFFDGSIDIDRVDVNDILTFRVVPNEEYKFKFSTKDSYEFTVPREVSKVFVDDLPNDFSSYNNYLSGGNLSGTGIVFDSSNFISPFSQFVDSIVPTGGVDFSNLNKSNFLEFKITIKDGFYINNTNYRIDITSYVIPISPAEDAVLDQIKNEIDNNLFKNLFNTIGEKLTIPSKPEYGQVINDLLKDSGFSNFTWRFKDGSQNVESGKVLVIQFNLEAGYELEPNKTNIREITIDKVKHTLTENMDFILKDIIQSKINFNISLNADNEVNHRISGNYKLDINNILSDIYGLNWQNKFTLDNKGFNYDALSFGSLKLELNAKNLYKFEDSTGTMVDSIEYDILIQEVEIKESWRVVKNLDDNFSNSIQSIIENLLGGYNVEKGIIGKGTLDVNEVISQIKDYIRNNLGIEEASYQIEIKLNSKDENSIKNNDVYDIVVKLNDPLLKFVDTSTSSDFKIENNKSDFIFENKITTLDDGIHREYLINSNFNVINIENFYKSGYPISSNVEYDLVKLKDNLEINGIVVKSIELIGKNGNVLTNGQIGTETFKIRITYEAKSGNVIVGLDGKNIYGEIADTTTVDFEDETKFVISKDQLQNIVNEAMEEIKIELNRTDNKLLFNFIYRGKKEQYSSEIVLKEFENFIVSQGIPKEYIDLSVLLKSNNSWIYNASFISLESYYFEISLDYQKYFDIPNTENLNVFKSINDIPDKDGNKNIISNIRKNRILDKEIKDASNYLKDITKWLIPNSSNKYIDGESLIKFSVIDDIKLAFPSLAKTNITIQYKEKNHPDWKDVPSGARGHNGWNYRLLFTAVGNDSYFTASHEDFQNWGEVTLNRDPFEGNLTELVDLEANAPKPVVTIDSEGIPHVDGYRTISMSDFTGEYIYYHFEPLRDKKEVNDLFYLELKDHQHLRMYKKGEEVLLNIYHKGLWNKTGDFTTVGSETSWVETIKFTAKPKKAANNIFNQVKDYNIAGSSYKTTLGVMMNELVKFQVENPNAFYEQKDSNIAFLGAWSITRLNGKLKIPKTKLDAMMQLGDMGTQLNLHHTTYWSNPLSNNNNFLLPFGAAIYSYQRSNTPMPTYLTKFLDAFEKFNNGQSYLEFFTSVVQPFTRENILPGETNAIRGGTTVNGAININYPSTQRDNWVKIMDSYHFIMDYVYQDIIDNNFDFTKTIFGALSDSDSARYNSAVWKQFTNRNDFSTGNNINRLLQSFENIGEQKIVDGYNSNYELIKNVPKDFISTLFKEMRSNQPGDVSQQTTDKIKSTKIPYLDGMEPGEFLRFFLDNWRKLDIFSDGKINIPNTIPNSWYGNTLKINDITQVQNNQLESIIKPSNPDGDNYANNYIEDLENNNLMDFLRSDTSFNYTKEFETLIAILVSGVANTKWDNSFDSFGWGETFETKHLLKSKFDVYKMKKNYGINNEFGSLVAKMKTSDIKLFQNPFSTSMYRWDIGLNGDSGLLPNGAEVLNISSFFWESLFSKSKLNTNYKHIEKQQYGRAIFEQIDSLDHSNWTGKSTSQETIWQMLQSFSYLNLATAPNNSGVDRSLSLLKFISAKASGSNNFFDYSIKGKKSMKTVFIPEGTNGDFALAQEKAEDNQDGYAGDYGYGYGIYPNTPVSYFNNPKMEDKHRRQFWQYTRTYKDIVDWLNSWILSNEDILYGAINKLIEEEKEIIRNSAQSPSPYMERQKNNKAINHVSYSYVNDAKDIY